VVGLYDPMQGRDRLCVHQLCYQQHLFVSALTYFADFVQLSSSLVAPGDGQSVSRQRDSPDLFSCLWGQSRLKPRNATAPLKTILTPWEVKPIIFWTGPPDGDHLRSDPTQQKHYIYMYVHIHINRMLSIQPVTFAGMRSGECTPRV
jgi:hypothetical protein